MYICGKFHSKESTINTLKSTLNRRALKLLLLNRHDLDLQSLFWILVSSWLLLFCFWLYWLIFFSKQLQHAVHTRISFMFNHAYQILCYLYVYGRERRKFSEHMFNPIVNSYNKICSNQTNIKFPDISTMKLNEQ
jgi:hypothetical protein